MPTTSLTVAGYVGPFSLHPAANYAIVVGQAGHLAMSKRRNTPTISYPDLSKDAMFEAVVTALTETRKATLLFANRESYLYWMIALRGLLD